MQWAVVVEGAMAKSNFENLRVYQLAETLADEIWDVVKPWKNFAKDTVGKQIVRAADSIGANIAEGDGRGTLSGEPPFCPNRSGLDLTRPRHWLRRAFKRAATRKRNRSLAFVDHP